MFFQDNIMDAHGKQNNDQVYGKILNVIGDAQGGKVVNEERYPNGHKWKQDGFSLTYQNKRHSFPMVGDHKQYAKDVPYELQSVHTGKGPFLYCSTDKWSDAKGKQKYICCFSELVSAFLKQKHKNEFNGNIPNDRA